MSTVELQRAADAQTKTARLRTEGSELRKRYRSYVDRLAPTIVMNGLGQALAMERAAAGPDPKKPEEKAHRALYDHLQQWLCREDGGVFPGASDLLEAIISHGQDRYLRAQAEALAWLEWHKRFCRASLPKGEEE